jgi:type I restriction enzyme S subunit
VGFRFVVGAQGVKLLSSRSGWSHRFLFYALHAADFPNRGYSRHFQFLKRLTIPRPALPEQERIVAEVEKQFTRLDAGVEALKRLQAHLRRYRAAVLKAACEGRLVPTEAALARTSGRAFESAEILMSPVAQARDASSVGRRERRTPRREGAEQPLPFPLPEGWTSAPLGRIAVIQGGITKGQRRNSGQTLRPVPYLRVANVQRGFLHLAEIKTIEATAAEIEELRLQPRDILFNEGGDRDKLGRGWVWSGEIAECIHQNHVFRARLCVPDIEPKFVSWYGNSFGQRYFLEQGKQTTNLASINMTKLSALPVPIPPINEQKRIVAECKWRCRSTPPRR